MLDSPFEFCPLCREYVMLDQTQRECAGEHGCAGTKRCPLLRCFTGIDFGASRITASAEGVRKRRPGPRAR